MEIIIALKKRRSVKKFSKKKPDWRKVIQSIDAARYAPMAGNQFSLKLMLIRDEKKITKLSEATQQNFVDAPMVIVVVSDREKVRKTYDDKGKGFAAQQAGAAIQNILLTLTEKGIGGCWVGYFYDKQVHEVLEIPNKMTVEALIPVGFMPKNVKLKDKKMPELENVIYFDKWKNKNMTPDTKINRNPRE